MVTLQEVLLRMTAARGLAMSFEVRPQPGAPFEALDRRRFEDYHRRRFGKPLESSSLPFERLLGGLKFAAQLVDGRWVPTNVGLLLFSEDPRSPGADTPAAIGERRHGLSQGSLEREPISRPGVAGDGEAWAG